ncbi:MAG: xanthine dehydrogenase family protein subunit M [Okeania sp. SIO2C9]|uniref:FAD binding domain-containing protein n=1 Tax=Okeania sp. SIO2C9 TaxID=2607791 RepID=UPI0013BEFA28|nr:xanthine dehydrogenase family protein subunit M [Okeania sp. SIO2C9]NEQ72210.1 xanthine dehydrogenase family protein subunit M [Okeania sp. SIO2C9]
MQPFSYARVNEENKAITTVSEDETISFIAGGTDLIGLIKDGVQTPKQVVDINPLPLDSVEVDADNNLRIGALVTLSDVARYPTVKNSYPVISEAILESASPQLRNMATVGGNLLQRTRCNYFRDPVFPCNRRIPGTSCPAMEGYNRMHAILGTSEHCIATHPSDLAVALVALDAVVCIQGKTAQRRVPINDFYLLPGETPHRENVLEHGELIIAVEVPAVSWFSNSYYLKVRDRANYEFALVSVALALEVEQNIIKSARLALGGVGTKPWRSQEAETALEGKPINDATFSKAAEAALTQAKPQQHNQFKIELAKRAIIRALSTVLLRSQESGVRSQEGRKKKKQE